MPIYEIEITKQQEIILSKMAAQSETTVQVLLNQQAFFRVREQLQVWADEYLKDNSLLTTEELAELDNRLINAKIAYLAEIGK